MMAMPDFAEFQLPEALLLLLVLRLRHSVRLLVASEHWLGAVASIAKRGTVRGIHAHACAGAAIFASPSSPEK